MRLGSVNILTFHLFPRLLATSLDEQGNGDSTARMGRATSKSIANNAPRPEGATDVVEEGGFLQGAEGGIGRLSWKSVNNTETTPPIGCV